MSGFPMNSVTPLGKKVILSEEYWLHIGFRHPEIGSEPGIVLRAVSNPDELYRDKDGGIHLLKKVDGEHYLAVICRFERGEGFIMTAYLTSIKRKSRRYRALRRLKRY